MARPHCSNGSRRATGAMLRTCASWSSSTTTTRASACSRPDCSPRARTSTCADRAASTWSSTGTPPSSPSPGWRTRRTTTRRSTPSAPSWPRRCGAGGRRSASASAPSCSRRPPAAAAEPCTPEWGFHRVELAPAAREDPLLGGLPATRRRVPGAHLRARPACGRRHTRDGRRAGAGVPARRAGLGPPVPPRGERGDDRDLAAHRRRSVTQSGRAGRRRAGRRAARDARVDGLDGRPGPALRRIAAAA